MKKKISILGSTGSIGSTSLNIISQYRSQYEVITLTGNQNVQKLSEQAIKFQAKNVVIGNESKFQELKNLLAGRDIKVYSGYKAINNLASQKCDITIIGISGIIALYPIMHSIGNSKILGLANKESIVCAGQFIINKAKNSCTKIIPLDSEHNAISQILEVDNKDNIDKVVITASGGPFLQQPISRLKYMTANEAVRHPNWKMGKKISVDCANMVNKGIEVIEACILFDFDIDKVEAIIHRQSIIHGMIHYNDGTILTHMGFHDMRTPISTVLNYPKRLKFNYHFLDLNKYSVLSFEAISAKRFPLYFLARQSYKVGRYSVIIFTIANEVAVDAFLNQRITFLDINYVIQKTLDQIIQRTLISLEEVFSLAQEAQKVANHVIMSIT